MAITLTPSRLGRLRLGAGRLGGTGDFGGGGGGGDDDGSVTLPIFEDFENGALGSDVGLADTTFTQIVGSAATAIRDDAHALSGALAAKITTGSLGGKWRGSWKVAGRGPEFYGRIACWLPDDWNETFTAVYVTHGAVSTSTGTGSLARILLTGGQTIRVLDRNDVNVFESGAVIPVGQAVRLEYHLIHAGPGSVLRIRFWNDVGSPGTPDYEVEIVADFGFDFEIASYWHGVCFNAVNLLVWIDSLGLATDDWLGPAVVARFVTGGGLLVGNYLYRIYIRDEAFRRVALVDQFSGLGYTMRFDDLGAFTLVVPADSLAAERLVAARCGIVIVRDGEVQLSGPVRSRHWTWDSEAFDAGALEVSGPDDLVYLQDRQAFGDPADPPWGSQAFDVRTGVAETVLQGYVDANAGPGAIPERQVGGLVLATDLGRGTTITGRTRSNNLLLLLQELAIAGGDLGFRVAQAGAGTIEFGIYEPVDRSDSVELSITRGTLGALDLQEDAPEANWIIAAGDGTGTGRVHRENLDGDSVVKWGRREMFLDQRGTSDGAELHQGAAEQLVESAEQTAMAVQAIQTEGLSFGRDYKLGDRVAAVLGPGLARVVDVVREVSVEVGDDGEQVLVTIGTPGARSPIAKALGDHDRRALAARVARLEMNP